MAKFPALKPVSPDEFSSDIVSQNLDIRPRPVEDILNEFLQELGLPDTKMLEDLQKSGQLDKLVGRASHYVSLLALSVLVDAIRQGKLTEHSLVALATKLPVVAQKLSGTDIQKTLILDEEKLKSLLEPSTDGSNNVEVEG